MLAPAGGPPAYELAQPRPHIRLTVERPGMGGIASIVGPMAVYVTGMGMVMPNATAAAMEPVPHMAGFASSIIGCLQTASGGLAAFFARPRLQPQRRPNGHGGAAFSAALTAVSYFDLLARSRNAQS